MNSVPGQTTERCAFAGKGNRKRIRVRCFHDARVEKYRQLARSSILDTPHSLCNFERPHFKQSVIPNVSDGQ